MTNAINNVRELAEMIQNAHDYFLILGIILVGICFFLAFIIGLLSERENIKIKISKEKLETIAKFVKYNNSTICPNIFYLGNDVYLEVVYE